MKALVIIFFIPYLYRKIVMDDWALNWWDIPKGPLLLRRPAPGPPPEGVEHIPDFYKGHLTREELDAKRAAEGSSNDIEKHPAAAVDEKAGSSSDIIHVGAASEETPREQLSIPKGKKQDRKSVV